MEGFKRELRKRVFKFFGISSFFAFIISLLILIFTTPMGQDKYSIGFRAVYSIFYGIYFLVMMLIYSSSLLVIKELYHATKKDVIVTYVLGPIFSILFFLFAKFVFGVPFSILFLGSLPFLIGQIISLFLILKFIKKNKPENLPS